MHVLTEEIAEVLERASWIRRMFEAGIELKQKFGPDNVYDFSLGNPDLPPPETVAQGLRQLADRADEPYVFGYMPNAGYPETRVMLAERLSQEQGVSVQAGDVVMTCGAAGALNSLFRAVLEAGEEVVCPAPYFVEYGFYASNYQASLRPVPCLAPDFRLDLAAMEEAVTDKTRIVLLNSPNNPTGRVYSPEELQGLVQILKRKQDRHRRPIFLVSDEPYRFLTYDGVEVAPILPMYEHSLVVSSFSKNLSMAGERIGYLLVNPAMGDKKELLDGLVFTNRILGFVNAPAIGQQVLNFALNSSVDVAAYHKRRSLMQEVLDQAGYAYAPPQGGFYFFVQAPGGDDLAFVQYLQKERVLAVPGTGFGYPGYFRMAFCVPAEVIDKSRQSMAAALKKAMDGAF